MGVAQLSGIRVAARLRYGPFGADVVGRSIYSSAPLSLAVRKMYYGANPLNVVTIGCMFIYFNSFPI